MSDLALFLGAFPRIANVCRTRQVRTARGMPAVTAHQAEILGYLHPNDPTMVGELAAHLGVTPSTMSLNLKRLERDGFLTRERDPADRRVMNVLLTEAGDEIRQRHSGLDPDRVDRMLHRLDPARRRIALKGLAMLAEAAESIDRNEDAYVKALTEGGPI